MGRTKQNKLPKHPDWRLIPQPSAPPGQLTLGYGVAVLRLRFWPRASAALRPTPASPWIDGARHAERLLHRYFRRVRFRHLSLEGRQHWIDQSRQIYFPFFQPYAEEIRWGQSNFPCI